jgi:hypothetical protein
VAACRGHLLSLSHQDWTPLSPCCWECKRNKLLQDFHPAPRRHLMSPSQEEGSEASQRRRDRQHRRAYLESRCGAGAAIEPHLDEDPVLVLARLPGGCEGRRLTTRQRLEPCTALSWGAGGRYQEGNTCKYRPQAVTGRPSETRPAELDTAVCCCSYTTSRRRCEQQQRNRCRQATCL